MEQMLAQVLVRHGGKIIFRDVEDEESGQKYDLTVAQYIAYDLAQDDLTLVNPLYSRILAEAVEQSATADFDAEKYFLHHPDGQIQSLAVQLSMDNYQLSDNLKIKESEERLRELVTHLVLDFRLSYVKTQLKQLQDQLKQALAVGMSTEEMFQLMQKIKEMQTLRNALATQLGSDIV